MKRIKILFALIVCLMLAGCGKKESTTEYTEYIQREAGAPGSDWGTATTGSAKYLDGSSVLVTIYLDDVNSQWLESDEQLIADNMKAACDYLTEQGKLYGMDVNLIYDTSVDGDLAYRLSYKEAFGGSTRVKTKGDKADQLVYSVYDYIENNIDTEAILKKYNVNSIGYMVFIDGEADRCAAYCYHLRYQGYYYPEFCLINLRWNGGRNVYPDTYAHEILHIFGARDLYYTNEYDGMSRTFIDYVYENYPTDIMLGYASDVVTYSDKVTSDITKITAYYLGWQGYITELEDYPYIKSQHIATFSKSQNTAGGDFLEYTLDYRKIRSENYETEGKFGLTDDKISALISLFVVVVMLAMTLSQRHRLKKKTDFEDKKD